MSSLRTQLNHLFANPSRPLAFACLALSMALVGSYVALSKPLAVVLPIFLLAWLRFGIGAIAMASWLKKPAYEAPMSRHTHALLFLESFLGNVMFTVCMLFGVSMTSAVSAGVIMASIPAVVALMSWIFLREEIGWRIGASVACAAAGIALLAFAQPTVAHGVVDASGASGANYKHWLGNALVFGAVICEAFYSVIGKKLTGALSARRISSLINLWGLVMMTPFGIYQALKFDFTSPSISMWLLLLFYSLAASVWTVWLWMTGLKGVAASQAGVFTVMLPISAAAVGVLALGETLSGLQWIALGVALFGVILATRGRSETTQSASPLKN